MQWSKDSSWIQNAPSAESLCSGYWRLSSCHVTLNMSLFPLANIIHNKARNLKEEKKGHNGDHKVTVQIQSSVSTCLRTSGAAWSLNPESKPWISDPYIAQSSSEKLLLALDVIALRCITDQPAESKRLQSAQAPTRTSMSQPSFKNHGWVGDLAQW